MYLLLALVLTAHPASAKSMKKMSDADLGALLVGPDIGKAADAAEVLGTRHTSSAIATLGTACPPTANANACEAALGVLEDLKSDEARAEVQKALETQGLADSSRHKALKILKKQDRTRLAESLPGVLAAYRTLDDGFCVGALDALGDLGLKEIQDITILIAKDGVAKRRVRLAALEVAEKIQHPALWTAYLELLKDSDTKVRVKSAKGLGRSGIPGSVAVPALSEAARHDEASTVRTAAFKALRFYAYPGLLPILHEAALQERDPFAWSAAIELLMVLADKSSTSTLCQLIAQQPNLLPEAMVSLIHVLVRIGDPSAVPTLEALARQTEDVTVRTEAEAAIALLRGPEPERVQIIQTYTLVEVQVYEPTAPPPPMPRLSVEVGPDGMAIWMSGM